MKNNEQKFFLEAFKTFEEANERVLKANFGSVRPSYKYSLGKDLDGLWPVSVTCDIHCAALAGAYFEKTKDFYVPSDPKVARSYQMMLP